MHLHSEHSGSFIHALAAAISKDPTSLECWRFVHIEHGEISNKAQHYAILDQLQKAHSELECDMVQCADDDIFFITRSMHHEELHALANEFINAASIVEAGVAHYALYDLFRDADYVRDLLLTKTGAIQTTAPKPSAHHFGETASLSEVFQEAKKLRNVRMPLHVMVVEDDPLTRLMLTGAFNKNYALITAANAQEAMMNYLVHAPDIVFLDIGLPDASGFDVLHHILATDRDAYVVMFSSNSYLDNVTRALSSGASGFVAKPFKKERMRQYIQNSALHHRKHPM